MPTGFSAKDILSGPRRYAKVTHSLASLGQPKTLVRAKEDNAMAKSIRTTPLDNKKIQQAQPDVPNTAQNLGYDRESQRATESLTGMTPGVNPFRTADVVGLNGGNTNTMNGFAGQYAPGFTDQLYNNPEILAQDTLSGLGYNGNYNSGMMPQLTNIATAALPLSVILGGGALPTNNATINFANDLLNQSMTPGGQYIDPNAALAAIFGAQPGDPLYSQLAGPGMTSDQQSQALNSYIAASIGGLNPVAQNAVMNSLDQSKLDYARAIATGQLGQAAQPYFQYVANNNVIPGFGR